MKRSVYLTKNEIIAASEFENLFKPLGLTFSEECKIEHCSIFLPPRYFYVIKYKKCSIYIYANLTDVKIINIKIIYVDKKGNMIELFNAEALEFFIKEKLVNHNIFFNLDIFIF